MKTLIPSILEGMVCLFGAFTTGRESFFSRNTFMNEEFLEQFSNEKDKELLNSTVSDLKTSEEKSRVITLTNNTQVKIVVD